MISSSVLLMIHGQHRGGQLLFLESENPEKEINLYINSPGASSRRPGDYDTMQFIKPDVSTICTGQAASMGAVLWPPARKGKRYCLPHARVMIHQPLAVSRPGQRHGDPCPRDTRASAIG